MRPVNWKELDEKATKLIVAEQNASFGFLIEKLRLGSGTISKLLKRLERKHLVRRGKQRRWTVIVNADGTPKSEAEIPPVRTFRKAKRRKHLEAPAAPGPRAKSAVRNGVDDDVKIEVVQHLADLASGRVAGVLQEVVSDLLELAKYRKLFEALRD